MLKNTFCKDQPIFFINVHSKTINFSPFMLANFPILLKHTFVAIMSYYTVYWSILIMDTLCLEI